MFRASMEAWSRRAIRSHAADRPRARRWPHAAVHRRQSFSLSRLLQPVGNSRGWPRTSALASTRSISTAPSFLYTADIDWTPASSSSTDGSSNGRLPGGTFTAAWPVNASIQRPAVNSTAARHLRIHIRSIPNPMAGLLPDIQAKNASTIPRQDL